jgi:hypothetical protein
MRVKSSSTTAGVKASFTIGRDKSLGGFVKLGGSLGGTIGGVFQEELGKLLVGVCSSLQSHGRCGQHASSSSVSGRCPIRVHINLLIK